jgi:hypothetical protein
MLNPVHKADLLLLLILLLLLLLLLFLRVTRTPQGRHQAGPP